MTDPAPDPLRAALGRVLEAALARAVALDAETQRALDGLEGRELGFALEAPPLALRLRVEQGRLRVGPERGAEADLSVRATLGALLGQLLPGGGEVGRMRISGDAQLARRLQQLVQRYQPDLEAAFAQRFGEVWGVQLARALRRGLEALRDGSAALLRDGAEYLSEEARDLVPKAELEAHLDEVDAMRDAVDRLEARIARVRRRVGGGGGEGT